MSRIIDVFTPFTDGNGDPLSNGYIQCFENETAIEADTYSDPDETILNPANIPLNGEGKLSLNVFASELLTVKIFNSVGSQVDSADNIRPRGATDSVVGQFDLWIATVFYDVNDIVKGSNGEFYKSLSSSNIGNDPTVVAAEWENIRFLGLWNTNITYLVGDVVQTSTGNLWKAVAGNTGNNPETDDGTIWGPAVNSESILTPTNTAEVLMGGGSVTALLVNEIQDGSSYTVPLANSVNEDQYIIISQALEFVSFQPELNVSPGDLFINATGTDTNILFDNSKSIDIRLTSDGVSRWRLTV